MTDKELIKQEIERRIELLEPLECEYNKGSIDAYKGILQFINSLPEESTDEANCTTKNEDLEEACDNYYDETWDEHGGIAMVVNNCHDIWFPSQATSDFFKAGAEWQKQQMKEALQTEYEKGLFDMQQEMMKDAVETTIVNDWQYGKDPDYAIIPAIHQRINRFNVGDKVKIIIIKEEQQ